jgi:hypothetical protein
MARKPQPLMLGNSPMIDREEENDFNDRTSTRSALSPKSPKSPRSPFRFNTSKKTQSDQPLMQTADSQPTQTNLPPSASLSSIQSYTPASGKPEKERPTRTGFFSNYKASKSSSRLQHNPDVAKLGPEDMSRDTDRPAMSGKVSSKENSRSGTTLDVSSSSTFTDFKN